MTYQNGKFSLIKKSEGPLWDSTIGTLLLDENNILWIGSSAHLKAYDVEKKVFRNIEAAELIDKLPDDEIKKYSISKQLLFINSIKEDTNKTIWIASKAGLTKFQDRRFTKFSEANGFPNGIANSLNFDSSGNRIVQESLNNIIKHSEAAKANVQIKRHHSRIHLINSQDRVEIIVC